jgi:hypothetical protein
MAANGSRIHHASVKSRPPNLHFDVRGPNHFGLTLGYARASNSRAKTLATLKRDRVRHDFPIEPALSESVAYLNLHRQSDSVPAFLVARRVAVCPFASLDHLILRVRAACFMAAGSYSLPRLSGPEPGATFAAIARQPSPREAPAMKKAKVIKRAKKRSPVKDVTPKNASAVKGGAISVGYKPQKPDGSL